MDVSIDGKYLMCKECQAAMESCFNYKSTCICSEDSIAEYIVEGSKLDLEAVYDKQWSKKIPRDHKICRLCMKITAKGKCLFNTNEYIVSINDKLQTHIPELNIDAVKDPVICEVCIESIQSYSEFAACCLNVEKSINRYCEARGVDKRQADLYKVLQFIQNEALGSDITECAVPRNGGKLDSDDTNFEINCIEASATRFNVRIEKNGVELEEDRKSGKKINENNKTKLFNGDQVLCPGADQFVINGGIHCDEKKHNLDKEEKELLFLLEDINGENAVKNEEIEIKSEADISAEDNKDLKVQTTTSTKKVIRSSGKRRRRKLSTTEEGQFCEICIRHFKTEKTFSNHIKNIHQSPAEMFKCEKCSFKSRYKKSLEYHMMMHMNPSELKMYSCKSCPYKAKRHSHVLRHELTHKDPSERLRFKCPVCARQYPRRGTLKDHMLMHKNEDEIKWFKCDECPYKAKRFGRLKEHVLLLHKHIYEVEHFNCNLCSYQTKHKCRLMDHQLIHKNLLEVPTFNCHQCPYKAKRKTNLKSHLLIHQKNPKLYSCDKCSMTTKHKHYLKRHIITHMDISETQTYSCHKCTYKTKNKYILIDHIETHSDKKMFKCEICQLAFKTRRSLRWHTRLIHETEDKVPRHKRSDLFGTHVSR